MKVLICLKEIIFRLPGYLNSNCQCCTGQYMEMLFHPNYNHLKANYIYLKVKLTWMQNLLKRHCIAFEVAITHNDPSLLKHAHVQ